MICLPVCVRKSLLRSVVVVSSGVVIVDGWCMAVSELKFSDVGSKAHFERLMKMCEVAMSRRGGLDRDGHFHAPDVEMAVGALWFGQLFGWRVLDSIHAPSTLRKYSRLLGIQSYKDVCPEKTEYSSRHHFYRWRCRLNDWNRDVWSAPGRPDRAVVDS